MTPFADLSQKGRGSDFSCWCAANVMSVLLKFVKKSSAFGRYECADKATTLQNTNRSTIKVYYRFHAYAGQELEVIHYPIRLCEWVIVRTPRGCSLKIPQWMVQPSAYEIVISSQAILSANSLAQLMQLVPGPDLREPSATVPQ